MRKLIQLILVISSILRLQDACAVPVTIDYAVFYTPAARIAQGGTSAIEARIQSAFTGANQLFVTSGLEIMHRVVLTKELPLSNTSETLPELGTELALGFNFNEAMIASQADSSVTIVEFQRPGGFANIPISRRQAFEGGSINLGLPNVSAGVLAHEIGHTLGSGHDYSDTSSRSFDLPPEGGAGNHFIGNSGTCYRTIMSALTTCRVSGHQAKLAINSERFSGVSLLFDGVPTGKAALADNVSVFNYYAPLVASARGESQLPPSSTPSPIATEPPSSSPTPIPGEDDDERTMPDNWDTLTLRFVKSRQSVSASGRCLSSASKPLTGDGIAINKVNPKSGKETSVKKTSCRKNGTFSVTIGGKGSYRARNLRTGRESDLVKLKQSDVKKT